MKSERTSKCEKIYNPRLFSRREEGLTTHPVLGPMWDLLVSCSTIQFPPSSVSAPAQLDMNKNPQADLHERQNNVEPQSTSFLRCFSLFPPPRPSGGSVFACTHVWNGFVVIHIGYGRPEVRSLCTARCDAPPLALVPPTTAGVTAYPISIIFTSKRFTYPYI